MASLRWGLVSRRLREIRPDTVLEVGCGQGSAGARLASSAAYLGVEPDEQSFTVARGRVEPLGGEVRRDDAAALAAWLDYLRPGGYLMLSVPAWPERYGPMDAMVGHCRRYSPQELQRRLTDAGLVEPRVTLYGWPLGRHRHRGDRPPPPELTAAITHRAPRQD